MTSVDAPIGAKVQVTAGIGYVRWTGSNPKFAAGKWVGVELLEGNGKNDGSVQGERYFDCKPKYGVFVRPSQVQVLEAPSPSSRPSTAKPHATPATSRITSSGSSRAGSPLKPAPTPRASQSTPSTSRTGTSSDKNPSPPQANTRKPSSSSSLSATPRTALGASTSRRPPSVAEATPTRRAPTPSVPRVHEDARAMPPPPPVAQRPTSPMSHSRRPSAARHVPTRSISSALSPTIPSTHSPKEPEHQSSIARSPSPDKESSAAAFVHKREVEELKIKLRLLESRRTEDQERIKSLESKVGEADTLRAARVKLQAKFQELQSSLVSAQRSARDLQSENAHLETRATEAMDQLEMATLDREVAEEKAEAAELETEKLNERIAELELELAVMKEENAEYEKPVSGVEGGTERSSLAFVQLEKHNERLKEALIRLRDVSTEAERDHKTKLAELKRELSSQEDLASRYEMAEAKLANAEAQVEDLKMQLDDALGAEDMLEQLTERNLHMGERIEEMRGTIEDLEALKELNDELEESHVEAEKQLNEEIDDITGQLRDERLRSNDLDAIILDTETMIGQFRELVGSLQSEIDTLRMQQATQESESESTSKEAQALMNLNLKLQSSAAKTQSKTIDLELKRLEATQLAEHTRIITAYLPDPYHDTEVDSTTLFLFFHRLSSKVDILITTISAVHGLPASLQTATSEALVGICELRGKLRHFSTLNKRFATVMQRSPPDEWVALGKVLAEVNGVEARIDSWIGMIRNDEFNEGDCARDLSSLIAQFNHLSETAFNRPELDIGEQQLGLAYSFDYDLDNFAAAVGFARQAIVGLTEDGDIPIEVGESSLEDGVYEPVQHVLDLVRNVKIPSGKLLAEVEAITHSGSAMSSDLTIALSSLSTSVSNAVDLAVQLAQRIGGHVATLRSSKEPLRLTVIERFLDEVTVESANANDAPPWELIASFVQRLAAEVATVLPKVKGATKGGQVVQMDVEPPWLARVAMIKEAASFNANTERQVVRLSEELKDMLREIKIRDQSLQESGVKVETLERRLEATRKQVDQIVELENDVAKAKKQEKVYEDAIEQLQKDLDVLEAENAKLGKGQSGDRQANASNATVEPFALASVGGLEASQLAEQIENLRGAIRYLRSENTLLKSKDLYQDLHLLPSLSHRVEQPVPELESSSPGSPASSSSSLDGEPSTPTRHSLGMESKLLYQEITAWQSSPRIVDVSSVGKKGWHRRKGGPDEQVWAWRLEEKRLEKSVERLAERSRMAVGSRRRGV